jgi:hypothetical protein
MLDAMMQMEPSFDWNRDLDTVYKLGYTYEKGYTEVNFEIPEFRELRDYVEIHV